jgi:hypothetical protein
MFYLFEQHFFFRNGPPWADYFDYQVLMLRRRSKEIICFTLPHTLF